MRRLVIKTLYLKMIKSIIIEDLIDSHKERAIEVVLNMTDGTNRWCFFLTPQGAAGCGDYIEGTKTRIHYGAPHVFIVSDISKEIIESAIKQAETEGNLLQCTLPI